MGNRCDLCGSKSFKIILDGFKKSFLSDSTTYACALNKVICTKCGLIRNGRKFNSDFLKLHYEKYYKLEKKTVNF